jgi:Alpha-L-arabinofuranosidase B (ABFB) domain/Ricin-type beta-trefoil lectin domain-like
MRSRALDHARRWAALLLLGGCSLRSLDYLEDGGGHAGARASGAPTAGAQGGTGPAPSDGGAPPSDSAGSPPAAEGGEAVTGGTTTGGSGGVAPTPPDCTDSLTTADETDTDCGGRTCSPCTTDQRCITGTDCDSAICTNQICQAPSCTDLAVNGDETDKNCGGSCPKCAQGFRCEDDDDCATSKCDQGTCVSATCVDDVLTNGCPLLVDNTAYSFAPSHEPGKCVDVRNLSVASGAALVLWSCRPELQQTFWAVDQMDGYFALRSALSGKCLQVRGSSTADGAVVEQATCVYSPSQLWQPTRVDDSLMQLTSKLTGFFLDVAGNDISSDGQAIAQSKAGESADTRWRVTKRTAGAHGALAPYADRSMGVHHAASSTQLTATDDESAHWKVVPGLYDASLVSFQSRDEPGRYLRHSSFRLWSDSNDGSTQFKKDATFRFASPFVGTDPHLRALEAANYAGMFWMRSGSTIVLSGYQNTDAFKSDATWWLLDR